MTDIRYVSTREAAEIMSLSTRRVVGLCNAGKLEGALRKGRNWKIPEETVYAYMGTEKPKAENGEILACAVGNTSYTDVVKNSYYVDKTLLIRDLIDDQVPVILFTRPRRFGKTLALDMLKTFFEKTKEDTSIYFKDKQIWACGKKYQKLQGAFPVISITFKDVKFSDWTNTYAAMKNVIRDEFMRHDELFTSDSLNPVEQDYLSRMQSDELSEVEYTRALLNLGRMLKKHHRSKVVILIDEYDTPIQQGHSRNFYNEVITFMRNFMSGGLKDNPFLAFGILTGILRVSKENLFSGLNNPIVNTVLDEKYSKYFGFTVDEVNAMAAYYDQEAKLEDLREWYDGDNTPAMIYTEIVPGENIKITVGPKGFGSENMSAIRMFKPSAGLQGIKDFIIETVETAGPNPCPPMVVGVGIGGTFDKAALLAKKALMRPIDSSNPDPFYADLENEMLEKINQLGIGPQGFGGKTTAIGLNIETLPTHIAGMPCAININCHVTRHKTEVI